MVFRDAALGIGERKINKCMCIIYIFNRHFKVVITFVLFFCFFDYPELANDFLTIVDKCPEKLKKSIMAKVTKVSLVSKGYGCVGIEGMWKE